MDTLTTDYHFTNHYSYTPSEEPVRPSVRPSFCSALGRKNTFLYPNPVYFSSADYAADYEANGNTTLFPPSSCYFGDEWMDCTSINTGTTSVAFSCRDAKAFFQKTDEIFDFEKLESFWAPICCKKFEELYGREEATMLIITFCTVNGVMGLNSTIASSTFIWMLRRSHDGFSTTQNRLLLGLCISDIVFSIHFLFFNMLMPKDHDYWIWNARGNMTTCQIDAFFFLVGGLVSPWYNASLCALYLAIVMFQKSDEYIRTKLKPFFHLFPVVFAFGHYILRLKTDSLYPDANGSCVQFTMFAPHCRQLDDASVIEGMFGDAPCNAGNTSWNYVVHSEFWLFAVPPIVMIICLTMIYIAVLRLELKMSKYGARSIFKKKATDNATPPMTAMGNDAEASIGMCGKFKLSFLRCIRDKAIIGSKSKSRRKKRSKSRTVMYKGLAYSCSWFISWGVWVAIHDGNRNHVQTNVFSVFLPLQGIFNLAIYMHPKVLDAKNSKRENLTWCQAIVKAFWSKGIDSRKRVPRGSNKDNYSKKKEKDQKVKNHSMQIKATGPQSETKQNVRAPQDVTHLSFGRRTNRRCDYLPRPVPTPLVQNNTQNIDGIVVEDDHSDGCAVNNGESKLSSVSKDSVLSFSSNAKFESSNIGISYATDEGEDASC